MKATACQAIVGGMSVWRVRWGDVLAGTHLYKHDRAVKTGT